MKPREKFHTLIFFLNSCWFYYIHILSARKKANLAKEIFCVLTFTSYANFTKVLEDFFFKP